MWKYRHTARLILVLLASPCFGQWSEIWTNGDLFASQQMASECYSGVVERCKAAGVDYVGNEWNPVFQWIRYIVGKNRAKCVDCKTAISSLLHREGAYYLQFVVPYTNLESVIVASNAVPLFETDDAFTDFCGLPRGFLDETPYFKLQYSSTSNGWHGVKRCIDALTKIVETPVGPYTSRFDVSNGVQVTTIGRSTNSLTEAWNGMGRSQITNLYFSFARTATESYSSVGYWWAMSLKWSALFRWKPEYDMAAVTNFDSVTTIYASVIPTSLQGTHSTQAVFDSQADNVSTNLFNAFCWTNFQGASYGPFFTIQTNAYSPALNHSSTPLIAMGWSWCPRTTYPWSYESGQTLVVHDFASACLTNGFRYK